MNFRKSIPMIVSFAILLTFISAVVMASTTRFTSVRIGNTGTTTEAEKTAVSALWIDTVQVDNGKTSGTLSLTGVLSTDHVLATCNTSGPGASILSAVPSAGQIKVVMSGSASTTLSVTVAVYREES